MAGRVLMGRDGPDLGHLKAEGHRLVSELFWMIKWLFWMIFQYSSCHFHIQSVLWTNYNL